MQSLQFFYFDLGNVLVNFDHEIVARNLSELTGVSPHHLRQVVFGSGLEDRYELGQISSEEFVDEIGAAIGKTLDLDLTLRAVSDMFHPNESMLSVLRFLKAAAIPMGLLSNTCEAHWNWIHQREYETVGDWFCQQVLSFQVGAMKPSAGIYEYATKMACVDPAGIFFTDDKMDNVVAARSVGWHAEQFISAEELLHQIRNRMGILPAVHARETMNIE